MIITLTSIRPPHTNDIFDRTKIIEWRKKPLPLGIHHVYETKYNFGQGKVIGSMEIIGHYCFKSVYQIPEYLIREGGVSRDFLLDYVGDGPIVGNAIVNPQKFDSPRAITEYFSATTNKRLFRPSQTYIKAIYEEQRL